jgi:hypothetical protein
MKRQLAQAQPAAQHHQLLQRGCFRRLRQRWTRRGVLPEGSVTTGVCSVHKAMQALEGSVLQAGL